MKIFVDLTLFNSPKEAVIAAMFQEFKKLLLDINFYMEPRLKSDIVELFSITYESIRTRDNPDRHYFAGENNIESLAAMASATSLREQFTQLAEKLVLIQGSGGCIELVLLYNPPEELIRKVTLYLTSPLYRISTK